MSQAHQATGGPKKRDRRFAFWGSPRKHCVAVLNSYPRAEGQAWLPSSGLANPAMRQRLVVEIPCCVIPLMAGGLPVNSAATCKNVALPDLDDLANDEKSDRN